MIKDSPHDYLSYSSVTTTFEWITMGMESPPKKRGSVIYLLESRVIIFGGGNQIYGNDSSLWSWTVGGSYFIYECGRC